QLVGPRVTIVVDVDIGRIDTRAAVAHSRVGDPVGDGIALAPVEVAGDREAERQLVGAAEVELPPRLEVDVAEGAAAASGVGRHDAPVRAHGGYGVLAAVVELVVRIRA